jgi:uncharacterized protein (TIGR00299 family) protein
MVLGALVDAGLPLRDLVAGLAALPVSGYRLRARSVMRGAIHATKVDVMIQKGLRAPLTLRQIDRVIAKSRLPAPVKKRALEVFQRLAEAEGVAHGVRPGDVHFHEVGVLDSFVDVVGGLLGCHLLGVESVTASPINLGSGTIHTAHGTLPVPGPAVAALAQGVPVLSAGPPRELATPTGLALARTLSRDFVPLPPMRVRKVGYGAGTADPQGWPNVLRVFVGDISPASLSEQDTVTQIETNLDDMNPQAYDTVMDRLFAVGALDVTLTPVTMKRSRPGIILTALVAPEKADETATVILRETTALGVRMTDLRRRILARRLESVRVGQETVHVKVADLGHGETKASPEYRDCKRIAEHLGRPVREVMESALLAYQRRLGTSRSAKVRRQKYGSEEPDLF